MYALDVNKKKTGLSILYLYRQRIRQVKNVTFLARRTVSVAETFVIQSRAFSPLTFGISLDAAERKFLYSFRDIFRRAL